MFQNLNIRWTIIACIIIASIYYLTPSYQLFSIHNDPDLQDIDTTYLKEDAIKLGLDLQGGIYIILELEYDVYLKNIAAKNLSNQQSVDLTILIKDVIQLSNTKQSDILDELLNYANTNNIQLKQFYSTFSRDALSNSNKDIIYLIKDNRIQSMKNILSIMRNRIENHNQYGVGEPSILQLGSDRMVIELAGVENITKAKDYIQRTAEFKLTLVEKIDKFKEVIAQIDNKNNNDFKLQTALIPYRGSLLANEEDYQIINTIINQSTNSISNKYNVLWDNNLFPSSDGIIYRQLYLVRSKAAISGGQIKNPKALISEVGNEDAGNWVVNLDMTREGKVKWSRFTGNNIGNKVAIVLDNKVYMAPNIQTKISSGGTRITGFADKQEAEEIANVLQAGELPAPVTVVQMNYIGPSLGADSINSGSFSMILGLICIFIFMMIYYNLSGLIANMALFMNMMMVFAILITMNAVLTLPGIAGLLLTVGMTVDANIIIFERIREELKLGNKIRPSIINGYNRAFITILDANVTTLITAFVLSFIGSGPIKGFATTLSIGILCSMFTAIFVTKTIFLSLVKFFKIQKLSI